MSNYFDIHCDQCRKSARIHWNWGREYLEVLVKHRTVFAALHRAIIQMQTEGVSLNEVTLLGPESQGDWVAFFGEHAEHGLKVRGEYEI